MFDSDIIKDVLAKNGSKRDVKKKTLNAWHKRPDISASYVDKLGTKEFQYLEKLSTYSNHFKGITCIIFIHKMHIGMYVHYT